MDFFDEHPALYACEWCGELFEATLYPQSCPQCGRMYGDFVYGILAKNTAAKY